MFSETETKKKMYKMAHNENYCQKDAVFGIKLTMKTLICRWQLLVCFTSCVERIALFEGWLMCIIDMNQGGVHNVFIGSVTLLCIRPSPSSQCGIMPLAGYSNG